MNLRIDAIRQHLAEDNARLREALILIADIGEGGDTLASLRNCARIARTALVSATPENRSLACPSEPSKIAPSTAPR